jgi:stearoyl-CoA desaturase (delta-9 desaturase)
VSVESEEVPFGVVFGGRAAIKKWLEYGLLLGSLIVGSIAALIWHWFHPITWIEIASLAIGFVVINIGVGMCLHRYFSHQSFEAHPALRYVLGAFACMACEGPISKWAMDHRRHHAQADHCGDIHSPHIDGHCHKMGTWRGLLQGHIGWLFDNTTTDATIYGKGLSQDPVIRFFDRTRVFWYLFSLVLFPGAFGYVLGGTEHMIGSILFGGFLRTFVFLNLVLGVNSIGHRWGSERYPEDNHSKNNYWLALLTFGDGFHNNHHYFPRATMAAHRWWEIDVNGYLIHGLERLGLVWNVVRVPPALRGESIPTAPTSGEAGTDVWSPPLSAPPEAPVADRFTNVPAREASSR